MVVALDIKLAQNVISKFSMVGKPSAKVLMAGGIKFHIPVNLS